MFNNSRNTQITIIILISIVAIATQILIVRINTYKRVTNIDLFVITL